MVLGALAVSRVSSTWEDNKQGASLVFPEPSFDQFKSGFGTHLNEFMAPVPEPRVNYQIPAPEPSYNHLTPLSEPGLVDQAALFGPGFNHQTLVSMPGLVYQEPGLNHQALVSGLGISPQTPISELGLSHWAPAPESSLNHLATINEPGFNQRAPLPEPSLNNQAPVFEPSLNHQAPVSEPEFYHWAPNPEPGLNHQEPISEPSLNHQAPVSEPGVNNWAPNPEPGVNHQATLPEPNPNQWAAVPEPEPEPSNGNFNEKDSSSSHGNAWNARNKDGNSRFPFERNIFTGKKAYQPMLPGFPEVNVPDGFQDICFSRVKAAFAKAYPSLPKLTEQATVISEPMPKLVGDLPHYAFPTYTAEGVLYAPYRIPTSNFPMFIPFNASVEGKLELDRHPLFLPFTQLTASDSKYGREYPIYLGFATKQVRADPKHAACGSDIFLPFKVNKNEFYRYRRFSLVLPRETQPVQSASKLSNRAVQFEIPPLTPIGATAHVISNIKPQYIPMPEPFFPAKYSQFIPSAIPIMPMIQADTKGDWGSIYNTGSGLSWDLPKGSTFPTETLPAMQSFPAISSGDYAQSSVIGNFPMQEAASNFQAAFGSSTKAGAYFSYNPYSPGSSVLTPSSSKSGIFFTYKFLTNLKVLGQGASVLNEFKLIQNIYPTCSGKKKKKLN